MSLSGEPPEQNHEKIFVEELNVKEVAVKFVP